MTIKQLILLGHPGVGVKAQAQTLSERWLVPQVSTGALIQAAIDSESALGLEARPAVQGRELVADAVVMKLIRRRFEQPDTMLKGWVLTGFPRTLAQAQAFDDWWVGVGQPAAQVVYLKAIAGLLLNRLYSQPGQTEPLVSIRRDIERYEGETAPLVEYYQAQGRLKTINGSLSSAEVGRELAQLGYEESGAIGWIRDEAELDALLARESLLVVDCMASWCSPCKQITPLIDQLAAAYGDRVTIKKIDFDANQQISKRFGLKGMPAVMFFKAGELRETLIGVKPYQAYSDAVTRCLP